MPSCMKAKIFTSTFVALALACSAVVAQSTGTAAPAVPSGGTRPATPPPGTASSGSASSSSVASSASLEGAGVVITNGSTYFVRNGQATSLTSHPAPKGHMTLLDGTTAPIPDGISGIESGASSNLTSSPTGGARPSGAPSGTPKSDQAGVAVKDGVTYVIANGRAKPADSTVPVGYMTGLDGSAVRIPASVTGLPAPWPASALTSPAPAPSASSTSKTHIESSTNPVVPSVNPRPSAGDTRERERDSAAPTPTAGNSGASRSGTR